jgi:hypothetical protein
MSNWLVGGLLIKDKTWYGNTHLFYSQILITDGKLSNVEFNNQQVIIL